MTKEGKTIFTTGRHGLRSLRDMKCSDATASCLFTESGKSTEPVPLPTGVCLSRISPQSEQSEQRMVALTHGREAAR